MIALIALTLVYLAMVFALGYHVCHCLGGALDKLIEDKLKEALP